MSMRRGWKFGVIIHIVLAVSVSMLPKIAEAKTMVEPKAPEIRMIAQPSPAMVDISVIYAINDGSINKGGSIKIGVPAFAIPAKPRFMEKIRSADPLEGATLRKIRSTKTTPRNELLHSEAQNATKTKMRQSKSAPNNSA
jgi:hypothetical protein